MMETSRWLEFAIDVAREAGQVLLAAGQTSLEVQEKGVVDLVTNADRASEALIRERIEAAFPLHDFLGEESWVGHNPVPSDRPLWIVDPLDGTTNFAHGLPLWSVSIACVAHGSPCVGVVHDPSRGETFWAEAGQGSFCNGSRIRVSDRATLRDSLLVTGFPYDIQTSSHDNVDHFRDFLKRTRGVRRLGSAAIDLAYVACGRFDGFWEMKLHAWDIAAGVLLVNEAGGMVSNFSGQPIDLFGEEIVASGGGIHSAMCGMLSPQFRANEESPQC